jgi:hypothetical protein
VVNRLSASTAPEYSENPEYSHAVNEIGTTCIFRNYGDFRRPSACEQYHSDDPQLCRPNIAKIPNIATHGSHRRGLELVPGLRCRKGAHAASITAITFGGIMIAGLPAWVISSPFIPKAVTNSFSGTSNADTDPAIARIVMVNDPNARIVLRQFDKPNWLRVFEGGRIWL